jgi:hypothetical protein
MGWSQREGSNLRPADYEPTGLGFQIAVNKVISRDAKPIVLRLCSPAALLIQADPLQQVLESRIGVVFEKNGDDLEEFHVPLMALISSL